MHQGSDKRNWGKAKRLFDLGLAIILLPFVALPVILIALAVKITSRGPVLYWSRRSE